jgi:hypothetical protein
MTHRLILNNFDDIFLWIGDILIIVSNIIFFFIFDEKLRNSAFDEDYCPGSKIYTISKGSHYLMIISFFLLGISYSSLLYVWRRRAGEFRKMNQCLSQLKILRLTQYLMNSFNMIFMTWVYFKPEEHVSCPELLRATKGYLITFLCLGLALLIYITSMYTRKPSRGKEGKLERKAESLEYGSI